MDVDWGCNVLFDFWPWIKSPDERGWLDDEGCMVCLIISAAHEWLMKNNMRNVQTWDSNPGLGCERLSTPAS